MLNSGDDYLDCLTTEGEWIFHRDYYGRVIYTPEMLQDTSEREFVRHGNRIMRGQGVMIIHKRFFIKTPLRMALEKESQNV